MWQFPNVVYLLIDPRDGEGRYVGATTKFEQRKTQHLCDPAWNDDSYRARWLRKLKCLGLQPEMVIIGSYSTIELMYEAEMYWENDLRAWGCRLVNTKRCGIPVHPTARTAEACVNISLAKLGTKNPMFGQTHSDETKRKMSVARSGSRNGNFGKRMSDTQKEQIREALTGRPTGRKGVPNPKLAGENHGMFGKHHTEVSKQKMSKSKKGISTPNTGRDWTKAERIEMSKRKIGVKIKCGNCKELGHNKQTCTR